MDLTAILNFIEEMIAFINSGAGVFEIIRKFFEFFGA